MMFMTENTDSQLQTDNFVSLFLAALMSKRDIVGLKKNRFGFSFTFLM